MIPASAQKLLPILLAALTAYWPTAPTHHVVAGQVEQESAWAERATLRTSRELGRGLAQLSIAYNPDGSERFNAYREAKRFPELRDWKWRQDPYSPKYQLACLVLFGRENFNVLRKLFRDDAERWCATLVAYNAGRGRVMKRRAYAIAHGIPCDRWRDGLDRAIPPQERVTLYGRPLFEVVNEYPRAVFRKSTKYAGTL